MSYNHIEHSAHKAPAGKWRVIGVDTFDNTEWLEGDFDTKESAWTRALAVGGVMTKTHVYDDRGHHVGEAGIF